MKCVRRQMKLSTVKRQHRVFRRKNVRGGYLLLACTPRRRRGGCVVYEVVKTRVRGRCPVKYRKWR